MVIESFELLPEVNSHSRIAHFGDSAAVVRALSQRGEAGTSITTLRMHSPVLPEQLMHAGHHPVWQMPWSMSLQLLADYFPTLYLVEVRELADISILGKLCRQPTTVVVLKAWESNPVLERRLMESIELFSAGRNLADGSYLLMNGDGANVTDMAAEHRQAE